MELITNFSTYYALNSLPIITLQYLFGMLLNDLIPSVPLPKNGTFTHLGVKLILK